MSINLTAAGIFNGVYNELNGRNENDGKGYAYAVDKNIAHGGRAAGNVVLMPFVRAGVQQAYAERAER